MAERVIMDRCCGCMLLKLTKLALLLICKLHQGLCVVSACLAVRLGRATYMHVPLTDLGTLQDRPTGLH